MLHSPFKGSGYQANHQNDDGGEEDEFSDSGSSTRYSSEPEKGGNQCDDKEY